MKFSMPLFAAVLSASAAISAADCDVPEDQFTCECPCNSMANGGRGLLVDVVPMAGNHEEGERFCMGPMAGYQLVKNGSMKCVEECEEVPAKKCACPQYNKKIEDNEILSPNVPKPDKCVMKRSKELLMYEPNFPEGRPDVYIEVEISGGDRFQFYPNDYPEYQGGKSGKKGKKGKGGVVPLMDKDVWQILYDEQEKLGGQGFKLRYVSKNGPGEWNSCKYSPIAFDLDGNGVVEHITSDAGFLIDITGDGDEEHLSEWFSPNEGILIDTHNEEGLDDFNNGIITGDHLMGDMAGKYTDGFAKLATYDENCDDKLTGAELDGLYIWKDANSNLRLDDGELFTLAHFNIVALNTIHDDLMSYAELQDGSEMLMQDLWFDEFEARRRLKARRLGAN